MIRLENIDQMNQIAGLIVAGLTTEWDPSLPLEVSAALYEARQQMESLPQVIGDLNLATRRFQILTDTMGQMKSLARQAAQMPDDASPELRAELEAKFTELAHVLAQESDCQLYNGPSLTLINQAQAQSSVRILGYLDPIMNQMQDRMDEQSDLIQESITETIKFLALVAECYPELADGRHLSQTLAAVETVEKHGVSSTRH